MIFMVVAESYPGIGQDLPLGALAETAETFLKSAFEEVAVLEEEAFDVNGLEGRLMLSRARMGREDVLYAHWFHSRDDFIYQLMLGSDSDVVDPEELRSVAQDLLPGFDVINPSATYQGSGAELIGSYRSDSHRFALDLADSEWRHWPDVNDDYPEAVLGGLHGATAGFVIVPVDLRGLEPELEALADGLLPRIGLSLSALNVSELERLSDPTSEGLRMAFHADGFDYRALVLRGEGAGYLVAAWDQSAGSATGALEAVLHGFSPVPAGSMGEAEPPASPGYAVGSSIALNDIGVYYYGGGRFAEASTYFRHAFDLNPEDAQVLENLVDSLTNEGRFAEARKVLAPRQAMARQTQSLWSYLAFLMAHTGEEPQAADEYRQLFAAGYQNDFDLNDYAELLLKLGRDSEAIAEVAAYRATRDSADAAQLAASLHSRRGDYEPAIEILHDALDARPFNHGLRVALVETYHFAERHQEAIEAANSLIENGADAVDLLLLKGRSEMALGRFETARRSFETALEADPADLRAEGYLDYLSELVDRGQLARQTGP